MLVLIFRSDTHTHTFFSLPVCLTPCICIRALSFLCRICTCSWLSPTAWCIWTSRERTARWNQLSVPQLNASAVRRIQSGRRPSQNDRSNQMRPGQTSLLLQSTDTGTSLKCSSSELFSFSLYNLFGEDIWNLATLDNSHENNNNKLKKR